MQVKAAHQAASEELQTLSKQDESSVPLLIDKWVAQIGSHFSAIGTSSTEGSVDADPALQLNRLIADASQAWSAQVGQDMRNSREVLEDAHAPLLCEPPGMA